MQLAIVAAGFTVPDGRNAYYDHTGAAIVETRYPAADGGRIPAILGIKRAEMHRVMAARVAGLGVPMRLGTTVAALDQGSEAVTVRFSDGTEGRFDLVIGADGARSFVREHHGIEAREFPDWRMGFVELDGVDFDQLPGFSDFLHQNTPPRRLLEELSQAKRLMLLFRAMQ